MISKHLTDLAKGKSTQGEVELKTKKGTRMVEFRSSPMKKREKIIGFQSIVRDVTERKKMEEVLKRRLEFEKITSAISSRFVGVSDIDETINVSLADMGILSGASRVYLFLFSEDKTTVSNTHEWCAKGVSPQIDNLQNLPCEMFPWWMKKLHKGEVIHIQDVSKMPAEAKAKKESLERQDIKSLLVLPVYAGGELAGYIGFDNVMETGKWSDDDLALLRVSSEIIGNALERKRTEEKIRESEERLRNLYESIQDPLAVYVGREGRLLDYNKAFKRLSGYTDEELKDKTFLDFVHPDDHTLVLERYRTRYPEEKLPRVYEIRGMNKKGEIIPLEISVSTYKKKGKVIGIEVIHRDITERKAMERKLQEYAEHLEEMVEERTRKLRESQERLLKAERLAAIGELATMIGHDLRNPLSSIQNACYYLKMKLGASADEKVKKMFEVVDREISYANKIVNDLLDFSRVKKPKFKNINLVLTIKDALAQLDVPQNVKITTKFSEAPTIEADPDQLRRIFHNIALNGIQAMPNGGELTVSTKRNDDFVEVTFTDTGVGIPEENMDKLFTPLFTTKAQGVGLGLSICKNLVEAHNGRIEVRSKVGEGSTFTVKLPIHQTKGGEK